MGRGKGEGMRFPQWTVVLLIDDEPFREFKVTANNRASALRKAQWAFPVLTNCRVEWRVVE